LLWLSGASVAELPVTELTKELRDALEAVTDSEHMGDVYRACDKLADALGVGRPRLVETYGGWEHHVWPWEREYEEGTEGG
jgi:hypothetical protein